MSPEVASTLIDVVFQTLTIYEDRRSRKAVDDIVEKALGEIIFMKNFAATLVQTMEKHSKFQSHVGCYRLLKWSCLLLSKSQFAAVSKNASPDIYKIFAEELKDARIPYKDSPELIWLLLEFSIASSSFGELKPIFLDIYVKAVLNAKEKPAIGLSESFRPLFMHLLHEDFQNIVVPSSVKMLKRNPEIVLESVGILLKLVELDLSKYANELLSVILSQARHTDEIRRLGALAIVRCLSQKSSNPDALEAMFAAVKAVIGGSEGRLQFPYQRIGMFNALQELSYAPEGKYLSSLSRTICQFLLSCYKDEGNEEVKLAILSATASWAARSADAVQADMVSFIASGLKEKEVLRRGHLRCLRVICKNADTVLQISSLLGPLIQLVKTGFTKAVQRLDGVYALLIAGKIASADIKAEETLAKEKIWSLISQNEPALVQISLASKLSAEDCMACVELLEVLLVEHSRRMLCGGFNKVMIDTSTVLLAFGLQNTSDDNYFVKQYGIILRVHKCLQTLGFDVFGMISANVENLCKGLLGPMGLMSSNVFEKEAAISSLTTLMSITPRDIYMEFEKHLKKLEDRCSHDMLSENDIQIFHTPEGMLSSEQGVYVAESVAAKNTKQAKGRFRMYEDQDGMDLISSNHSVKREPAGREAAGVGKKDTGKLAKKTDKGKTAKEEARELLLKEEAAIREKVRGIQNNLSLILRALGEMALSNPVFAHSQLPSLVKFVEPLLQSPIVSDVAYESLVKLSRCTAPPLCNWAIDIATALRLIVTEEVDILLDLIPAVGEEEANESPSMGLFERIIYGLSVSCKSGPLPVDSFTFVFPIMERILLSSKKTGLHDNVLRILYLHMDPQLPLPRLRMLSALYHVLGVVPAYQAPVGAALNELCLGLQPDEVASALYGVYAKDVHVRMACLNAIKCIPAVSSHSLPQDVVVATSIWIALHDPEKSIAEAAEDIWDRYGYDFGTDYSGLFKALSHINYNVRVATAEALAAALDENPDSIQESLSTLFSLYIRDATFGEDNVDARWIGRQGIALALHSAADVLRTKDLPVVMTFLISRALASDEEKYDLDDPKVHAVVEKLLDVLNTPSEAVQRAVSSCLSPLMQSKKEFCKVSWGALLAFECFCEKLGKLFEPYVILMLPLLLVSFSDQVVAVREAAECAARAMMSQLSAQGVKLVLPSLLKGLEDKAWRTKQSSVQLLGAMAYCAPQQLSQCLPTIVPKLTEVLTDTHPKVQSAGQTALQQVGSVIKNPEISSLVPTLLMGLTDPNDYTKYSLDILLQTTFVNSIDAPSLALLVPIVHRGLRERSAETKKKAAQIVGNMCSLVTEPKDMIPYIGLLLPEVKKVLVDPIPEVRSVAARALGSLIRGMGEENFPDLVPWLFDTLKSDNSNVERSGAAQGLSEVLAALGTEYFEIVLPDIIRNCSHQRASVRDGYLTLFKYLPRSLGVQFQNYLQQVLPAILDGLADENESVRDAALGCLTCMENYRGKYAKDLKEIMPVLMNTLISSLASSSSERRQVAGRSLGELVRKLGVCIGLSEVMASAGKSQLLSFMDELIPTIRTALCDSTREVRESAGLAFSTLYKSAGMHAIDEIVPTLLLALEDDETSDTALDGLKQILRGISGGCGTWLNVHLGTVLPALLSAMGGEDKDVQTLAKQAAETVVLVIDEEGVEYLIAELLKGVGDSMASVRRSSSYLIGYFFKNSKLYLVDEAPNMMSTLIVLLSDTDSTTVTAAWEALSRVVSSVPKEVLPSYIKVVRDAVSTSRDKERRKKKGGPVLIPGFCLPKALQPLLPIFLQGLISGSAELREQAALGLGELIEVTSEQALKEFVIPVTGPLIRIIGDRFPWQVKSAILSTLSIIIRKGGLALKPFLPQLQTTFIKCLQDNTRTVRTSAALALGKLSALSTRVDPLVSDLLSSLQASDAGVREAILMALKGVLKHAGKSVSSAVKIRVYSQLNDLVHHDDDQVRISAASILGITSQYMEAAQLIDLLQQLSNLASSSSWVSRHGAVLTISSLLRHNPSSVITSAEFPSLVDCLKDGLQDEKFPLRETSTKALGRLLLHQIQRDPSKTSAYTDLISSIVSALRDDSSEVRRRALSALKIVAKASPSSIMAYVSIIGPALAECLKDSSTPVRLAAERCALHTFQLTKGAENVQAAQKFITGLDARRLSKFPEHRHVSSLRLKRIQRHLDKINKPSVMTIESPDGDIIDCVHKRKQPALDHPLLKNHKIQHAIAYTGSSQEVYGAKATVNVWDPSIQVVNEFSLSQIWVLSGSFDGSDLNSIEAGWQVSPELYGDSRPRLFTYWTDPKVGNWWLGFGDNTLVGYWPAELFTHLADHATMVEWGGEVVNSRANGHHTSTQMGSGHFAEDGFGKASYFRNLEIVDSDNSLSSAQAISVLAENTNCYNIQSPTTMNGHIFLLWRPWKQSQCPEDAPGLGAANFSASGVFRLGFFSPNPSYSARLALQVLDTWEYLIAYHFIQCGGHREDPVPDSSGALTIDGDGKLKITYQEASQ
ncbi:hypothetical protein GH714_022778 [Hevea brasiliensis]|uniref:Neprosin PEP catalytic domain-containing protein n=2 Tax=Magnoliopsida TaxID=3398 RepID=A0A6A6M4S3_HEVBR|nr:hypothetical protein GH714_022778 [Hevea brasiliensis]